MGNADSKSQPPPPISRVTRSKSDAKKSYDAMAKTYDRFGKYEQPYRDEGVKILAPQEGEKLLEVGFGTGHALVELARIVGSKGSVDGLDLSSAMKDMTHQRAQDKGVAEWVSLSTGDAAAMPYQDNTFNGVFSSFFIDLLDTPEIPVVLRQFLRVLQPGGRCVIVSMSKKKSGAMQSLYEWSHRQFPNTIDCRPIYVEESVREAGFEIWAVEEMPMYGLLVEIVMGGKPLPGNEQEAQVDEKEAVIPS